MAINRSLELHIKSIEPRGWDYLLHPLDDQLAPVLVDAEYMKSYAPQPGGIYIRFENGAAAYAPPGATLLGPLDVLDEPSEPATEDREP